MRRRLTVVTGGGRGIGAAVAERLAADGHGLMLSYACDAPAAEATADRVRAGCGAARRGRASGEVLP